MKEKEREESLDKIGIRIALHAIARLIDDVKEIDERVSKLEEARLSDDSKAEEMPLREFVEELKELLEIESD